MQSANLLREEETIAVTALERDWLYDQRIKAIRECPNLGIHAAKRDKIIPFPYRCSLRIYRRDKDGSLGAEVVLQEKGSKSRYIRRLRSPARYGSTGDRGIHLRRRVRAA